ncbi:MAG TPA: P-loop NTPase [Firmicutes bacterium]|nr:P-loop NTPase [Bacillota bacterium]
MKEPRELLVISGKGGTGKTSIVGAFATLAKNKVLADCDVDAADLHLLLKPVAREAHEFCGSRKAVIDQGRCAGCGRCEQVCRFHAVTGPDEPKGNHGDIYYGPNDNSASPSYTINPIYCEGCAVCYHACPHGAIEMEDHLSGHWFVSDTPYGPLVHARLGIAEENSGKLVAEVREASKAIAEEHGLDYIIIDGPPGIGCPVISSMSGIDLALVVTEPTISGLHDLTRALELAQHFGVRAAVCINKHDLDQRKSMEIEDYCRGEGIEVLGRIPFDEDVVRALINGIPVIDYGEGPAVEAMKAIWEKLEHILKEFAPA